MTRVDAVATEGPALRAGTGADLRIAGWAGIAGPVLFTVTFLAQETVRRDFDPLRLPVSALEAGPYGWVQQLSFVVFGVLTIVFAVGIHRGLRTTRGGSPDRSCSASPAWLRWPRGRSRCNWTTPVTSTTPVDTPLPGSRSSSPARWRSWSCPGGSPRIPRGHAWPRWTLGAGIACLVGFVVMGSLVIPDDAPLHDWAGLGQRVIILLALFPARIALSIRLLKTGR